MATRNRKRARATATWCQGKVGKQKENRTGTEKHAAYPKPESGSRGEIGGKIMEKHIMGENGISYTLGADGLYYPDLYLPEETEYPIGKYGMLRKTYLKEHRKGVYLSWYLLGN